MTNKCIKNTKGTAHQKDEPKKTNLFAIKTIVLSDSFDNDNSMSIQIHASDLF